MQSEDEHSVLVLICNREDECDVRYSIIPGGITCWENYKCNEWGQGFGFCFRTHIRHVDC